MTRDQAVEAVRALCAQLGLSAFATEAWVTVLDNNIRSVYANGWKDGKERYGIFLDVSKKIRKQVMYSPTVGTVGALYGWLCKMFMW